MPQAAGVRPTEDGCDLELPARQAGATEAGALLSEPTCHWWGAADRDRGHLAPPAATRADQVSL